MSLLKKYSPQRRLSKHMHNLRVLLTGCGAPGTTGTIACIRNYYKNAYIVGTDINQNCAGRFLVDSFYSVPRAEDQNYLSVVVPIIRNERINIIIPQTDNELMFLTNKDDDLRFSKVEQSSFSYVEHNKNRSVYILAQTEKVTKNLINKAALYKKAEIHSIPVPKHVLANSVDDVEKAVYELGYPDKGVFIKPAMSSGSRGCAILSETSDKKMSSFIKQKKTHITNMTAEAFFSLEQDVDLSSVGGIIVSEVITGSEFSVDCVRDRYSDSGIFIPRRRDVIVNGISFESTIVPHTDIITYSRMIARANNIHGVFGLQFIVDSSGIPRLIECNPRVQGTMVATMAAGVNIIGEAIKLMTIGEINSHVDIMWGAKVKRVWDFMLIDKDDHIC